MIFIIIILRLINSNEVKAYPMKIGIIGQAMINDSFIEVNDS